MAALAPRKFASLDWAAILQVAMPNEDAILVLAAGGGACLILLLFLAMLCYHVRYLKSILPTHLREENVNPMVSDPLSVLPVGCSFVLPGVHLLDMCRRHLQENSNNIMIVFCNRNLSAR